MRKSIIVAILALIPTISFAAEGASVSGFFWRVLVFVAFVGLLYKLLKKRVRTGVEAGINKAKKSLADAEKSSIDAKNELAEYSKKIEQMNVELENMKIAARKTADKEAEMMVADAEKLAKRLQDTAKRTISAEFEKAKAELGREYLLAAIDGAEKVIAADKDETGKRKFIKDNISKIGA